SRTSSAVILAGGAAVPESMTRPALYWAAACGVGDWAQAAVERPGRTAPMSAAATTRFMTHSLLRARRQGGPARTPRDTAARGAMIRFAPDSCMTKRAGADAHRMRTKGCGAPSGGHPVAPNRVRRGFVPVVGAEK